MTEERRWKSEKYTYIHEDKEKHRKFWTLVPCKFERGSFDFIMRKREREREDGARLRFYAGNIHEIRTTIEVLPTEIREL